MPLNGTRKRKKVPPPPSSSDESSSSSGDESDSSTGKPKTPATATSKKTSANTSTANAVTPNGGRVSFEHPLRLDPPTFSLGKNTMLDSNRYELWSVRLPVAVNIQDLDGCQITIPTSKKINIQPGEAVLKASTNSDEHDDNRPKTGKEPVAFTSKTGNAYSLQWGQQVENESFQLLMRPKTSDDDSDDDVDNGTKKDSYMVPVKMPFQRHMNAVSSLLLQDVSETKIAPGVDTAPPPNLVPKQKGQVAYTMRKAYQPVPQKTSLMKRRWMPLGSCGGAQVIQEETRQSRSRSLSASSLLLASVSNNHNNTIMNNRSSTERKNASRQQQAQTTSRKRSSGGGSNNAKIAVKRKRTESHSSGTDNRSNHVQQRQLKQAPPGGDVRSSDTSTTSTNSNEEQHGNRNGVIPPSVPNQAREDHAATTSPAESKAEKKARKAERKAQKREKKEAKKAKKEAKRAKKEAKKAKKEFK